MPLEADGVRDREYRCEAACPETDDAAEACSICRIRSLMEPPEETRLLDRVFGVFEGAGREDGLEAERMLADRGAPFTATGLPLTERGIRLCACGIVVS